MTTIKTEVDVDIDVFDTEEIIKEVKRRSHNLTDSDIHELDGITKQVRLAKTVYPKNVVTTADKMKYDHFMEYFDDFSFEALEFIRSISEEELNDLKDYDGRNLEREIDDLESTVAELEDDMCEMQREVSDLKDEKEKLEGTIEDLEAEIKQLKNED